MKNLLFLLFCLLACTPSHAFAGDSLPATDSIPASDSVSSAISIDTATAGDTIYPMSEERKTKLAAYSQFRNIWRFTDFFISIGILLLILFTGISAKMAKTDFQNRKKVYCPGCICCPVFYR